MKKVYQPILVVISSVLLILSFPGFNLWPLAWIALVPLFFAVANLKLLKAFLLSYCAGIIFFLGAVYWLIHVTLPGMIVVVLYLGLYFGLFGMSISYVIRRASSITILFVAPALWVTTELIRSFLLSGFGWALLAHSQSYNLPVIQIADITGAYGVSFLIVMANAAIFITIKDFREKRYSTACFGITLFLVFITVSYGAFRIKNIFTGELLRVAVIQGNIPQAKKWDADFRGEISAKYERLTISAAKEGVDLVIWPETSVPGFLGTERDLFARVSLLAKETKTPLLVGAPREDTVQEAAYYNSAILFDKRGDVIQSHDKIHLVPFGEYIPLKKALSFVEKFAPLPIGGFSPGAEFSVFKFSVERTFGDSRSSQRLVKNVKFSVLICFEDIFPDLTRQFVKRGANFLVNITNDAWFGYSSAPLQHAQCSIFRAVENRVNVVRAANTGLSCFIDQKGMIVDVVENGGRNIFVDGFAVHDIALARAKTFYTAYGDLFAMSCALFAAIYLISIRLKTKGKVV